MAFTTQIFLFAFFPLSFLIYYLIAFLQNKGFLSRLLTKLRAQDLMLIGISCGFYMWSGVSDLPRFLLYILIVWLLGRLIQHCKTRGTGLLLSDNSGASKKIPVALPILLGAVALVVFILVHFKYTGMLAQIWNFFLKTNLTGNSLIAPLGISFITFSAISYLVDIYRGSASAGSLIDCALYLSFFPKVVSGPIVLWKDFGSQIRSRKPELNMISDGVTRIMVGFAKKLILADTFGTCIASASGAVDSITGFGIGLLYMLQIYYDFSGYSDIAIGLSNMLGFSVKENFNFPYLSRSITEFWRRWHISLGTWFREYIYFPLGGNRKGKTRTLINIGIVFLLTGIWHGAGWTYMLWGIINGLCNITEKSIGERKLYKKIPDIFKWAATMVVTYFCWGLFRSNGFSDFLNWLLVTFGLRRFANIPYTWQYYFDPQILTLIIIGILGATVWGLPKIQNAYKRFVQTKTGYLINTLLILLLFVLAIMFMINSKYSPFIYFQY